jgi:hypothetical protein
MCEHGHNTRSMGWTGIVEPRRLWRRYLIVDPPAPVHFTRRYFDVKLGRQDSGISVVKKERPGPQPRCRGRVR